MTLNPLQVIKAHRMEHQTSNNRRIISRHPVRRLLYNSQRRSTTPALSHHGLFNTRSKSSINTRTRYYMRMLARHRVLSLNNLTRRMKRLLTILGSSHKYNRKSASTSQPKSLRYRQSVLHLTLRSASRLVTQHPTKPNMGLVKNPITQLRP